MPSPRLVSNNLNAARAALRRVRKANLLRRNTLKNLKNAGLTYKRKLEAKQKSLRPGALPHNANLYKNYVNAYTRNANAYRNYTHLAHNFLAMMSKKSTGFRSPRPKTLAFDPLKKGRYPQGINKKDEEKIKKYARYLSNLKTGRIINTPLHNNVIGNIGKQTYRLYH
jgi:PPE-repeat protein